MESNEGRPPTKHEIESISKRHKKGQYANTVKNFYESKKPMWTYPVMFPVNGSTFLSGFRRAIITLGLESKVEAHGCKDQESGDAVVLKRLD